MGDYKSRPLTFINTNIVINWSYYELKVELYSKIEELEIIMEFYDTFSNYTEWGEEKVHPIVWMELESDIRYKKSKNHLSKKEMRDFFTDTIYCKIIVYFETIIRGSPLEDNYIQTNTYWINCIGGLYNIADLFLYIEDGDNIVDTEVYKFNKLPYQIKDYKYEDLYEYSLETRNSAVDLCKFSDKWILFKF